MISPTFITLSDKLKNEKVINIDPINKVSTFLKKLSMEENNYAIEDTKLQTPKVKKLTRDDTIISLSTIAQELIENKNLENVLDDISISVSSEISNTPSFGVNIINKNLSKLQSIKLNSYEILIKILKMIKKLESKNHKRINLYSFIDMLRDMVYEDVSMVLFEEFFKKLRFKPRDNYLHYYIVFLNYAAYYHYKRQTQLDENDNKFKLHIYSYNNIKTQLNFIFETINKNEKN